MNMQLKVSRHQERVSLMLTQAHVPAALRDAIFQASSRIGLTPTEFAIQVAAEKLRCPKPFKSIEGGE